MAQAHTFTLLAQYNQRMNQQIAHACGALSHEVMTQNAGAFFGSILGTLNHIMVGDLIWLNRFSTQFPSLADALKTFPKPTALDTELATDAATWQTMRAALDAAIIEWADTLDAQVLTTDLLYKNTKGIERKQRLSLLITHFFNHQTHHRGQVSTLLNQRGCAVGVTDFLVEIPNLAEHA